MTVLLVGATGLVGRNCLTELVRAEDVTRVIALSRRRIETVLPPKVEQHVVDLADSSTYMPHLRQSACDAVICALGTTMQKAGSRAAFRSVDHDMVVAVARHAFDFGARRFLVVSSVGASPKSTFYYLRVKGAMEDAVSSIPFEAIGLYRPSLILGERDESRAGERILASLSLLLRGRLGALDARLIAASMVAGLRSTFSGRRIFHAVEILDLAGEIPST